jgi:hypothetical protein
MSRCASKITALALFAFNGRVSLCGDGMMRALLYEGAQTVLTRSIKWSWLKAWAMTIAKNRGLKRAIVALARRLAVIMRYGVPLDEGGGRLGLMRRQACIDV